MQRLRQVSADGDVPRAPDDVIDKHHHAEADFKGIARSIPYVRPDLSSLYVGTLASRAGLPTWPLGRLFRAAQPQSPLNIFRRQ